MNAEEHRKDVIRTGDFGEGPVTYRQCICGMKWVPSDYALCKECGGCPGCCPTEATAHIKKLRAS